MIIPLKSEIIFRVLTVKRQKLLKKPFVYNSKLSMGWELRLLQKSLLSDERDANTGSLLPEQCV